MSVSKQREWNKGDKEGIGGCLPTKNDQPLEFFRIIGKGTLDDPCATWISDPGFAAPSKRRRAPIHDGQTTRCEMTGRKTGYEPNSDQEHMTVYLGLLSSWIHVHGDLYTIKDKRSNAPVGLLPRDQRWVKDGQTGWNPELWGWTNVKAQKESESFRRANKTGDVNRILE
ncbi:hypothetical protein DL766_009575 [Monosporascus sp. MC13-8B]|uniref:Uncharacterized protein n=1 Tax=Monosporascus cannonballus TaxID=155416 RepID=A0ABY0HKI8_9PEZI|nr:hypothetical protein DL762_000158 [Monosporascus cannonballus]RYO97336.1 hypothetical protein DL763_002796 [Monosporascus cannonballus]RYP14832.1 hypothetical protein DL766_009575 [Monosporascus sp. MC13-8B]